GAGRRVGGPAAAERVLVGGPDDGWTYQRLNGAFRALRRGVPLVAMQRNRWWPTAAGEALDAGMFVSGLEYSAGVRATVVGHAATEVYRAACALVGAEPARAMMVGDDLESDLPPASEIGMR